ncbi:hypothetical protein ABPG73_006124, partial [Tetrahymena malaccensis]
CYAQLTIRQSDRAQIMYVQALTSTLSENSSTTNTFNFPQPFQNIPKAILSVQSYNSDITISQSYQLSVQAITQTSITIQVQSFGTKIYELKVGILAVDYPFVEVFSNTLNNGQTAIHKVAQKIQFYATFFTSFQANTCFKLEFNLNSSQIDDNNIQVGANNFKCVSSVDYNLLVFYYDINNFPEMPFYSFKISQFSDNINSNTLVKTDLNSPDTGFYGLKEMKLGSWFQFGIFFYLSDQNQPIQNGNYVFYTSKGGQIVDYANSQVFELLKLECPPGQYLYKQSCITTPYNGIYCLNNPDVCFDCDSKCLICQNSATNCLKCASPFYFYQNQCFESIQPGTFCDINNICQTCNLQSCSSCMGDANFCTSCISGYYYYNHSCTQNQPNQTYCKFNAQLNYYECFPCDSNCSCSKCTSFSVCQECDSVQNSQGVIQQYIFDEQNLSCYLNCPSGQYFDLQTRQCFPCDKSCLTCNGKTNQNCHSCIAGAKVNSQGMCQCENQKLGLSPDFSQCIPCQIKYCSQCFYSNSCEICQQYSLFDPKRNECVCMSGYFYSNSHQKCIKCIQSSCQICLSDGITCTRCQSGFLMTKYSTCAYCNNNKYSSDGKSCDSQCPNLCEVCTNGKQCVQYSRNDPFTVPNEICHYSCSNCSGLTKFDCLNCSSSTRFYNYKTKKCECLSGYLESNQKDCNKIQQVEPFIQNMVFKINQVFYFAQSVLIFLNLSPTLTYSYQLSQLFGNIDYSYHKDRNSNNLFSQYTKYNLNNLFPLNNSTSQIIKQNRRVLNQSYQENANFHKQFLISGERKNLRGVQRNLHQQQIIEIAIQLLDIVTKIKKKPLKFLLDFYTTLSIDGIFCSVIILLGVVLNTEKQNTKVICYTIIETQNLQAFNFTNSQEIQKTLSMFACKSKNLKQFGSSFQVVQWIKNPSTRSTQRYSFAIKLRKKYILFSQTFSKYAKGYFEYLKLQDSTQSLTYIYKLSVEDISLSSVTIQVVSFGFKTVITQLKIGILAVDYPFVEVFNYSLTPTQLSMIHKVDYKIQTYIVFFTSFQSQICIDLGLGFNLYSFQLDETSIKVEASNLNCLSSLDYNLLVIYYNITNFPDMPFYSYYMKQFKNNINKDTQIQTSLKSPDTGFYGIRNFNILSLVNFQIDFSPIDPPIQNGLYIFQTKDESFFIQSANSQVFDLLMLECPSNEYIYNQSCVKKPYDGVYCQENPNFCFDCELPCLTCQSSAQQCLRCANNLYLYNNGCLDSIQKGIYCDKNNICYECNLNACSSCINNPDFCTACIKGFYFYNNSCTPYQPSQTYCKQDSSSTYYECFPCNSNCKKCSGPLFDQCDECNQGIYFYQKSCTIKQPEQTVCENYICKPCFALCLSCFGEKQNECLTCIDNYSLNKITKQCEISLCKDGYFPDKTLNICQQCQLGCRKCIQFSICSECDTIQISSGVIQQYIFDQKQSTCYLNCLDGQYFDQQTRKCSICDKSCLTCNGKTQNDCLSCISGAQVNSKGMCECQNNNQGFSSDFSQCVSCLIDYCSMPEWKIMRKIFQR